MSIVRDLGGKSSRSTFDRARHRARVEEALKKGLPDAVANNSIIGKKGNTIIKVPVRVLHEPRFRYGSNDAGVGQGPGEVGDQIAGPPMDGDGEPKEAGNAPGEDVYDVELSLEDVLELMFKDLNLPELERKQLRQILIENAMKRDGFQKTGPRHRLDLVRTAANKSARENAIRGTRPREITETDYELLSKSDREFYVKTSRGTYRFWIPFENEDRSYRRLDFDVREESNAVVLFIMDVSGSMDTDKKYLAKSLCYFLYLFVLGKYARAETVFVAYHGEAKEVTEDEFFHKGESGGTVMSTGLNKALEIIHERFPPSAWNIYALHCSDGENFSEDEEGAIEATEELCRVANLVGYCEINPTKESDEAPPLINFSPERMKELFDEKIKAGNFLAFELNDRDGLWSTFTDFLSFERKEKQ